MTHRQETLDVLARIAGVDVATLAPEQHLVVDLGIDSPKALRLLVELEDRLDVEIEDEDAAGLKTVGDVLEYVARVGG